MDATNRYYTELRGLLALLLAQNRHARRPYPLVFQDSTALPVCKVARASQHQTFWRWARKSKTGSGWWYGFKLHVQCDEEGRLCAFALTTASVDECQLLAPLTQWMTTGIVVGDRGYISEAKAQELGARGIYVITAIRKNMRKVATQFQLACLQARHRIEEIFEFLKCAFGLVRTTHRASYALPIHLLVCLLAYSLYNCSSRFAKCENYWCQAALANSCSLAEQGLSREIRGRQRSIKRRRTWPTVFSR